MSRNEDALGETPMCAKLTDMQWPPEPGKATQRTTKAGQFTWCGVKGGGTLFYNGRGSCSVYWEALLLHGELGLNE